MDSLTQLAQTLLSNRERNRALLAPWMRLPLASAPPAATITAAPQRIRAYTTSAALSARASRRLLASSFEALRDEQAGAAAVAAAHSLADFVELTRALFVEPIGLAFSKAAAASSSKLTLRLFASPRLAHLTIDVSLLAVDELTLVGRLLSSPHEWALPSATTARSLVASSRANIAFEMAFDRVALVSALYDAALDTAPPIVFARVRALLGVAVQRLDSIAELVHYRGVLRALGERVRCTSETCCGYALVNVDVHAYEQRARAMGTHLLDD